MIALSYSLVTNSQLSLLSLFIFEVAPMQSVCDQILQEQASGQRELRHLKFIWIERDPILLQEVSSRHVAFDAKVELGKDTDRYDQAEHNLPGNLTARLLSLIPPEETTETELEEQYADGGLPHNKDDQAMKYEVENPPCAECPPCDSYAEVRNTTCAECRPLDRDAETLSADALHEPGTAEKKKSYAQVLDMQVYLTGDVPSHGGLPFVRFGRPDIQALFEEMKKEAFASGNRKVAVCVCAPQKLTNLCRRACVLYSDDEVRFDFHSEVVS